MSINRFLWILSAAVIVLFALFNFLTPLIADDYVYSLGIHSISDIIKAEYAHYFSSGGRSPAHFIARFWLLLGKPFFNIANTLVYCAFVLLAAFHSTGALRRVTPALFLAVNIFFWYLVPAWGQNFLWLDGSCNYLWTTTFLLFFLVPYRKKQLTPDFSLSAPLSFLFFIPAVLAGWSNENSGAAALALLILYFVCKGVNREKIALFEVTGAAGFLTGFLLLILAPGNYKRLEGSLPPGYTDVPLLLTLIKRGISITFNLYWNNGFFVLFAIVLLMIGVRALQKQKPPRFFYFYAAAALICAYSMVLTPYFPDRAFLSFFVFSCIALGSLVTLLKIKPSEITLKGGFERSGAARFFEIKPLEMIKRRAGLCAAVLLLLFPSSIGRAGKNITGVYLKWKSRMAYIESEKAKGNLDIEVKAPIPAPDRHAALHGLDDINEDKWHWANTGIAQYFGLRSITGTPPRNNW